MTDPARITDLETALLGAISYLRALPIHPETTRQANIAEAVLHQNHSSILQGGVRHPSGLLIVGAQLDVLTLTLKTEQKPITLPHQPQFVAGLYSRLVRGMRVELKQRTGQFEGDFFDIASNDGIQRR